MSDHLPDAGKMVDLDRLQALHEAATPGNKTNPVVPSRDTGWSVRQKMGGFEVIGDNEDGSLTWVGTVPRKSDADLIIAMRNALPALLAEVRALREENERLRSDVECHSFNHDTVLAEVEKLREERDALLRILPACCGSLSDAAVTMKDENAQLRAERERTEAALRALTKLYQFSSAETPKYLQSLGLWRKQETTNG